MAFGVGLVFGTALLVAAIDRTFTELYDAVYRDIDVLVSPAGPGAVLSNRTLRAVQGVPGVERVRPVLFAPGVRTVRARPRPPVASGSARDAVGLLGLATPIPVESGLRSTRGRGPRGEGEAAVDESWARAHHLGVGHTIALALPVGVRRFRVVGTFDLGAAGGLLGQHFMVVSLSTARAVLDRPTGADQIAIRAAPSRLEAVERMIRARLGPGIRVDTPRARIHGFLDQLSALRAMLAVLSAMGAVAGVLLVLNAFTLTTRERQHELGILRVVGADGRWMGRLVLVEALLLGLVGGAIGLVVGYGLSLGFTALAAGAGYPLAAPRPSASAVATGALGGVVVALLGAAGPARRATTVPPLASLRARAAGRRMPRRRRLALGAAAVLAGLFGSFGAAAGVGGRGEAPGLALAGALLVFVGVTLTTPFAVARLVRILARPGRRLARVSGRLAIDLTAANPRRTATASAVVLVGIALTTAVSTLGTSFVHSVGHELRSQVGGDLTIQPRGFEEGSRLAQPSFSDALRPAVARLPGVRTVTPERILSARESVEGRDATIVGVDPSAYGLVAQPELTAAERARAPLAALARRGVIVGEPLARDVGLHVGSVVDVRGTQARARFVVAAIRRRVLAGGRELMLSLERMRSLFGMTADSRLRVAAARRGELAGLRTRIRRFLDRRAPQLEVLTATQLQNQVTARLNRQIALLDALVAVVALISLFAIATTISLSVMERTRELGVLRALGLSRAQVASAVTMEGLFVALLGAAYGVVTGLALGYAAVAGLTRFIPGIDYAVPIGSIAGATIAALALALVASVGPALRAARIPVAAAVSGE